MIKVLHIIDSVEIGGGQRIMLDIIKNLRHNFDMSVLCSSNKKYNNHFIDEINNSSTQVFYPPKVNPSYRLWMNLLNQIDPDIIHIHYISTISLFKAIKSLNVKVYMSVHCDGLLQAVDMGVNVENIWNRVKYYLLSFPFKKKIGNLFNDLSNKTKLSDITGISIYEKSKLNQLIKSSYAKRNFCIGVSILNLCYKEWNIYPIAISQSVKRSIEYLYNVECKMIYNAIDLKKYSDYKKDNYKISNGVKLINIARFSLWKNQEFLIDVMKILVQIRPDIYLYLFGEGIEKGRVMRRVYRDGLDKNIVFMGVSDKLPTLLKDYDMLVMSSMDEGFGLVVLEGMTIGLPIIISNVGGMKELIQQNINGIIVEKFDPNIYAKAIIELIDDEEHRKKLGKEAALKASEFDIKSSIEKWKLLYSEEKNVKNG